MPAVILPFLGLLVDSRIDSRVDSRVKPLIETVSRNEGRTNHAEQRLSYLEGHFDLPSRIGRFAEMPPGDLQVNLRNLTNTLQEAQQEKADVPFKTLVQLRSGLNLVNGRQPEYWQAVAVLINYQTDLAARLQIMPNLERIKDRICGAIEGGLSGAVFVGSNLSGCFQKLDGQVWINSIFEDAIIYYSGGPLHLRNVQFVNCLFVVLLPPIPDASAERFANAIMSAKQDIPTFTVSTE